MLLEGTQETGARTASLALFGVILAAAVMLRAYHLGQWSLSGDEIYTVLEGKVGLSDEDSLDWTRRWHRNWARNANPLLQATTKAAFSVLGPTPFAARLGPFLAAVAALLVFPWLTHRWRGRRAAATVLLLLAFCPVHIEAARTARYQSLHFLFAGTAILCTILWLEKRSWPYAVGALLSALLTAAAHVTGSLLAVALLVGVVLSGRLRWKGAALILLLAAGIVAFKYQDFQHILKVVRKYIAVPVQKPTSLRLVASQVYNLGPLLCLAGFLGAIVLLRSRRPDRPVLLACLVLPAGVLLLLSTWFDVGVRYFSPVHAVGVLLAVPGTLFLAQRLVPRGLSWLPVAAITLSQMPLVISNQVDAQRYPYAEVAAHLRESAGPTDLILADSHAILEYYLERPLGELPGSIRRLEQVVAHYPEHRATLVVLRQRGTIATPMTPGNFEEWLDEHAVHREDFGAWRLDDALYRFEISVYSVVVPPDLATAPEGTPVER